MKSNKIMSNIGNYKKYRDDICVRWKKEVEIFFEMKYARGNFNI